VGQRDANKWLTATGKRATSPPSCAVRRGSLRQRFAGFAEIGTAHGPFDLTFIKIGAYGETWPDIHLTPEQAVDAHTKLRGNLLLPIHWGTFNLAFHAWDEPAERVVTAARAGTRLIMPKPGESVEPSTAQPVEPWWRGVRGK
jgi:L-ascorbate metabolism protein UlaG (beta-lactamase superfamily)